MSRSRSYPRKFSEKIALLNKREADTTAEFEKIIQEVEATTRAPPAPRYPSSTPTSLNWIEDAPAIDEVAYYNGYPDSSQQHYQNQQIELPTHHHHQQHHYEQQASTSTHMGLVPNIEISHTDDDSSPYYHQQQVNAVSVQNDRSSSMSAARSLPDIANLRVDSPNGCQMLSSSYSDQRMRSNTVDNNYNTDYNVMHSNEQLQDTGYFCSQQQPQTQPQTITSVQHQQPTINMESIDPPQGTYDAYYHQPPQPSSMVRASSSNAVMGCYSNNNTLYTPKMNNSFSRSSEDCCGHSTFNLDLDSLM